MDHKYISSTLIRLFVAICALLLIITLVYHSADLGTTKLSIAVAEEVNAETIINGEGYFFRKEIVLQPDMDGVSYSTLPVAKNVAHGEKVASVYPAGTDLSALKSHDQLIALLTTANKGKDLSVLSSELKRLSADLRNDCASGSLSNLLAKIDTLHKLLNQSNYASGGSSDLKKELERLKGERDALLAELGNGTDNVFAPIAGGYYPDCDGYEALFSSDKIDTLTLSSFAELTDAQPASANNAGKIVSDSYWYMVTVADSNKLLNTTLGKEYTVYVGERAEKYIFTLDRVDTDGSGQSLLIFGCRITPEQLHDRCEKVSIVAETTSGLTVPTASVRVLTNENGIDTVGVYVREGNYLRFKTIVILTEQKGSYIVKTVAQIEKENAEKQKKGETIELPLYPYLALNDVIVTSGKELKEGYFR